MLIHFYRRPMFCNIPTCRNHGRRCQSRVTPSLGIQNLPLYARLFPQLLGRFICDKNSSRRHLEQEYRVENVELRVIGYYHIIVWIFVYLSDYYNTETTQVGECTNIAHGSTQALDSIGLTHRIASRRRPITLTERFAVFTQWVCGCGNGVPKRVIIWHIWSRAYMNTHAIITLDVEG